MLGVVEYRDGFIEVRDSNWNTIGRFADAANAEGFDAFIKDTEYEDFENAAVLNLDPRRKKTSRAKPPHTATAPGPRQTTRPPPPTTPTHL